MTRLTTYLSKRRIGWNDNYEPKRKIFDDPENNATAGVD
jgi:hypothetical protein